MDVSCPVPKRESCLDLRHRARLANQELGTHASVGCGRQDGLNTAASRARELDECRVGSLAVDLESKGDRLVRSDRADANTSRDNWSENTLVPVGDAQFLDVLSWNGRFGACVKGAFQGLEGRVPLRRFRKRK